MSEPDPAVIDAAMCAMERYTGVVPGYRRAHAHGHGFVGHFRAAPEIAKMTVAEHLQGDRIPVIVRLSNGAGSPYAHDLLESNRGATLGLGIEFELPSGGRTTWGAPNITAFPAATPDEFVAVTRAQRPNSKGHPSVLRLLLFAVLHRRTIPGLKSLIGHPPVRSFAAADFHGLHAYYLVDARGRRQAFRYHWISTLSAEHRNVTREEATLWPPQFLVEEMRQRLLRGTVAWELVLELGADGDPTHDQTRAWPASRKKIHAGTLILLAEHPDQDVVESMVFDPTHIPPGIECSDDPLLAFRSAVYHRSHTARSSEIVPGSDLTDTGPIRWHSSPSAPNDQTTMGSRLFPSDDEPSSDSRR